MKIRVLLADDHAILRDCLRALLESHADIEVVGVAADGLQAAHAAQELQPDVIVMDIHMPGLNGLDACRRIVERNPAARVVILSMYGSREQIHRALSVGARGYLLKESGVVELIDAVHAVQAGRRYLSQKISDIVLDAYTATRPAQGPLDSLSAREREILQLIVDGHSNAQVASTLSISGKTVETYRSRLMQKLGIGDLPTLVKFAIEHGLTAVA